MSSLSLLVLPTEILLLIRSFISRDSDGSFDTLSSLCLCNRALRKLAQPAIFESVEIHPEFDDLEVNLDERTSDFHQFLLSNKALRQYVKHLRLSIDGETCPLGVGSVLDSAGWMQVLQIVTWLPNVRYLDFYRPNENEKLASLGLKCLSQCVSSMSYLEHISFSGLSLQEVVPVLQSLQRLPKLSKFALSADIPSQLSEIDAEDTLVLPNHYGSDSLRKIHIYGQLPVSFYSKIFSWSRNLQVLNLGYVSQPADMSPWSLQSLLLKHMKTWCLQELTFSGSTNFLNYPKPQIQQLMVNKLTSLRKITVRNWLPDDKDTAQDVYQAFLSGSIREIDWSFDEVYFVELRGQILSDGGLRAASTIRDSLYLSITLKGVLSRFSFKIIFSTKLPNGQDRPFTERAISATKRVLLETEIMLVNAGITAHCISDVSSYPNLND
jgi:hypothetical protein